MKLPKRNEKGFTLIELMIVIAIIGILAAIAIPQFNAYRARSYNASANTDVRNCMTALEGYFVDMEFYTGTPNDLTIYGLTTSNGVRLTIPVASTTTYTVRAYNAKAGASYAVTYTVGGPGAEIIKILP